MLALTFFATNPFQLIFCQRIRLGIVTCLNRTHDTSVNPVSAGNEFLFGVLPQTLKHFLFCFRKLLLFCLLVAHGNKERFACQRHADHCRHGKLTVCPKQNRSARNACGSESQFIPSCATCRFNRKVGSRQQQMTLGVFDGAQLGTSSQLGSCSLGSLTKTESTDAQNCRGHLRQPRSLCLINKMRVLLIRFGPRNAAFIANGLLMPFSFRNQSAEAVKEPLFQNAFVVDKHLPGRPSEVGLAC